MAFLFMREYTVYIIKSDLGYSYIGQTNNLPDRLLRHNSNRSKFTKNKGKWRTVITRVVNSRSDAVLIERKLKNMKNVQKAINYLEKLASEHPDSKSGGS